MADGLKRAFAAALETRRPKTPCRCGLAAGHGRLCRKTGPCTKCGRRTARSDNGERIGDRICRTCDGVFRGVFA